MPIITNCPNCERPLMTNLGITGTFAPVDCEDCDETAVVEQTRMDGKTYSEDYFVENIMPEKGMERIDANADGVYVYGDPEQVTPKPESELQ